MEILFSPVILTNVFFCFPAIVNPFGSHFSSLQSEPAEVEPINMPPTPSPLSEDAELSGEPVPEGTQGTTNLSAFPHSSPEQGKSPMPLPPPWVLSSDDRMMRVMGSISLDRPLNTWRGEL